MLSAILLILVVAVLVPVLLSTLHRRSVTRAARSIQEQSQKLYSGRHEYREVGLDEFRGLDLSFYECSTSELRDAAFLLLGDVEDLTATAAAPNMRAAIRILTSADRLTTAAIYHVKVRGAIGLLLWFFGKSSIRTIEFESYAESGLVIATSTSSLASSMDQPQEVRIEYLASSSTPSTLVERHAERLKQHESQYPETAWKRLDTLIDVLRQQEYLEELKTEFRRARGGGATSQEVRKIGGGRLADEVADRMDEIDEDPGGSMPPPLA